MGDGAGIFVLDSSIAGLLSNSRLKRKEGKQTKGKKQGEM